MCGIAGIIATQANRVSTADMHAALAKLAHRGPDGYGTWTNRSGTVGLLHTRLAIVDLAGGQQPIANERRNLQLVFNGEIYNHVELRSKLKRQGHHFRTQCDAEVLVHLYEEHGLKLFQHLNGMFAFALWDEDHQKLLLARDRLGQKPLYFSHDGSELTFASELKALRPLVTSAWRVQPTAVDDFLSFKYIPHQNGLFAGVQQLAPGHYVTWQDGQAQTNSYWSYPPACPDFDGSFKDATDTLRDLLRDATQLRLRSDVPVGVLLSGGIDSALVVGLIAESGVQPIRTFTASFAGLGPDERPYARSVAERFGTQHCELDIGAPSRELVRRVLDQFDEPFGDTSAIPTYLISQRAREHVKVVLTGDGGDESFLGYTRYAQYRRYLNQRRWIYPLMRGSGMAAVSRSLCPDPRRRTLRRRLRTFTNRWHPGPPEIYARWYTAWSPLLKRQLYRPDYQSLLAGTVDPDSWLAETLSQLSAADPVAGAAAFDLRHYLPDAVLTKVDRASMAHGLECRSPFLDHRIIEFTARLPTNWRFHPDHGSKWILRMACRDLLPSDVDQRGKVGFGAPVGDWLRQDLFHELDQDCLPANGLEHWLDRQVVQQMIADHRQQREDHTYRLWTLLALNRFWSHNW